MTPEELKRIITDQRSTLEEKMAKENIVEREFLEFCRKFISGPNVFLLSGIRRSGKSVLSYLLFRDSKFAYINFDDERLYGLETKELNNVLEAFYGLYGDVENVVLDEIQNVAGWELFVNRIRETKKVIVTGSNANLLSRELATHLTGRYVEFTVYPFSFREFLRYKGFKPDIYSTNSIAQTKNLLDEYIKAGGFPESYQFGTSFLLTLYDSIITKDVALRYGIRYLKALKELGRLLIANFSSEITFNKLKNVLGVKSVHTVKNYFEYLEAAFLVLRIDRFSFKLKEQILAPKKIYAIDTGMINSVAFQATSNEGKLTENLVAIELMRKKAKNHALGIFYWKDYAQNEVDFILKEKSKVVQLIQVCHKVDDIGTKEREIKALLKASEELKCDNLLVVTWDCEKEEKVSEKTITYKPLWKWLLE